MKIIYTTALEYQNTLIKNKAVLKYVGNDLEYWSTTQPDTAIRYVIVNENSNDKKHTVGRIQVKTQEELDKLVNQG